MTQQFFLQKNVKKYLQSLQKYIKKIFISNALKILSRVTWPNLNNQYILNSPHTCKVQATFSHATELYYPGKLAGQQKNLKWLNFGKGSDIIMNANYDNKSNNYNKIQMGTSNIGIHNLCLLKGPT